MPARLMVIRDGLWTPAVPDAGPDAQPDRENLTPGTYLPSAATTGVPAGAVLTDYNAVGTTGTVGIPPGTYERMHFYGDCYPSTVTGTYVFRECYFHGGIGHPGGNRGCVYTFGLTSGWATFEDCTVAADDPSWYRDGIVGHRYTIRRCNIHTVNDAIGGNANGGGIIEACWLHDLVWWRQDPAHDDGTHNDGVQIQGGGPWTVRGNLVECYVTADSRSSESHPRPAPNGRGYGGSCVIINQQGTFDLVHDTLIEDNWTRGGYSQLQLNNNRGAGYALAVALGDNLYGRDIYDNNPSNPDLRWICLVPNGGTITADGLTTAQRFEDTNALLTHGRATGIRTL